MHDIARILSQTTLGPASSAANLTVVPLLAREEREPGYLTLDEALTRGVVRVTEVSEAGSVPQLLLENSGPQPVLVLDGEELVGAKQNRIVNLTILVAPGSRLEIPVSCVEAGRWAHRSRIFSSAERAHYAAGRAMKLAHVNVAMRETGARHSDQGAIWDDIARKAERLAAPSPTSAAAEMYERRRSDLDEFEERLRPLDGQVGAVFAIDGVVAGLDLFDSPGTWRRSMRKLVQSYGLEAIDRRQGVRPDAPPDARAFLASVASAKAETYPALGLGTDVRLEGPGLAGAALVVDDRVVHLVAFPSASHGRPRRDDVVF